MEDGYLLIGEIVGVQGIRGNLKVSSGAESMDVFKPEGSLLIRNSEGRVKHYTVRQSTPQKKGVLLSLKGVEDRDHAAEMIGGEVLIRRSALPETEEGTYYWADLIGLSVYDTDGGYLGTLTSIFPTGSNDVYVVQDGKREILVPALASVVVRVDLEHKTMQVMLPEGL